MWPPGLGLVLASGGFGTIAAFLSLRFAAMGWGGAGLALTGFGAVYITSRLLFAGLPDRLGGISVAMMCLCVEACGLVLIGLANAPVLAFLGTALTGLGYSMVFPSLGVEVVRRVPPESRGVALGSLPRLFRPGIGGGRTCDGPCWPLATGCQPRSSAPRSRAWCRWGWSGGRGYGRSAAVAVRACCRTRCCGQGCAVPRMDAIRCKASNQKAAPNSEAPATITPAKGSSPRCLPPCCAGRPANPATR